MGALSALRTELQYRVADSTGLNISAARANRYINNALEDWVTSVEDLWRPYGWIVTAKKFRYDLPADWIKPKTLHWMQNGEYEIRYVSPKEFQRRGFMDGDRTTNRPYAYTIIDRDLWLGPAPGSTSNTSPLNGAHNSSVTTISVDDGTKFHNPAGWIQINSELIQHQGVSTNDLTLAIRGQGGTTAASHSDNDTVSRVDLIATYYHTPTALSSDTDTPAIEARWHRTLLHHAIGNVLLQTGREAEARLALAMYEEKKTEAKREVRRLNRDTYSGIYSPYR